MLIAITGTPGTGKTVVAKILAKMLDAKLVRINQLIENGKLKYTYDRKRKTKEIDEKELKKAVPKEIDAKRTNIIEGHLAHLLKANYVFVLRANPIILKKRLEERKWSKQKIKENVEAEFLDIISLETNKQKNVFEIDTSKKNAAATAQLIKDILNSYSLQKKYRIGKIDWTETSHSTVFKQWFMECELLKDS